MSDTYETQGSFPGFQDVMTGSLVAGYKLTHDEKYNKEYIRRLCSLGFTEAQAHNMFLFELMILKHDRIQALADRNYIYGSLIDTENVPLPGDDSWYIDHQAFLLSEIVKIWDEAEYLWQNARGSVKDEAVMKRIRSITRYGGGELFIGYLEMMAEKAHTDQELVNSYARAEQDMLYLYKWKQKIAHPYARELSITIKSVGSNKLRAIGLLREAEGGRLSIRDAADIIDNLLPYTIPYTFSEEKASRFKACFEEIGVCVRIGEEGEAE